MPILEIDGVGRVEVGPEFLKLSPEQQTATVQEIVSSQPQRGTVSVKPYAGPSAGDTALDVAKSGGAGLAKGAIGLAGTGGDIRNLAGMGIDYLANKAGAPPEMIAQAKAAVTQGAKLNPLTALLAQAPSSAEIRAPIEGATGKFYEPQTRFGEVAQTVGEFIPGALAGPGGPVRNAIAFGVVPGIASEIAGQVSRGTKAEPYARGVAAIGGGGVAGIVSAPRNVAGVVARGTIGADRNMLEQAEQVFQMAQQAGQPITRAEAVQYVTNGATNLGNLQRVVEGQGGMRPFFAERGARNDAAAGQVFDQVSHVPTNQYGATAEGIGPAVGAAAEGTVNDVRGVINAATDPLYRQAESIRLTPYEMQQVRAIPGYQQARDAVRNDPQLNRYVSHLPDDSVGFLNEVKKHFDIAATAERSALNPQGNHQRAAGLEASAGSARDWGVNASRRSPGNPYEVALDVQAQTREQYLQPLLDGPLGKIAAKDTTTKKAIDVLFPAQPLPNSADEIATAVSAVAQRNPYAARALVRAHLEMEFNQATKAVSRTDGSTAGAGFWKAVAGDPQQRANLQAAITSLPNGNNIWAGVDRFLTVLEAQSTRQPIGSQTAFNQATQESLRQGNLASEVGQGVASGLVKLPTKISSRVEAWRVGQNVDDLARLFTDPTAGREFMRLANTNSANATAGSVIRLVGLATRPAQSGQNPR